ncbi:MAG TPA: neocarzinostatin apoprotein domain-containing protein [Acidimicrobiales bacterium]|nr:neocarzinostatin apoprotein domain-containing protein [Acidimicrobiales bacterium]
MTTRSRSRSRRRAGLTALSALGAVGLAVVVSAPPAGPAGASGASGTGHRSAQAKTGTASRSARTVHLAVAPATGLDPAGSTVTVTGSGYLPDTAYYVSECDPAVPAGGACDMVHFQEATSDATGAFSLALTVDAQFGTTDCLQVACAVQTSDVGQPTDLSQEATVGLGFTGGPPPYPSIFGKAPPPPPGYDALGRPTTTTTPCPKSKPHGNGLPADTGGGKANGANTNAGRGGANQGRTSQGRANPAGANQNRANQNRANQNRAGRGGGTQGNGTASRSSKGCPAAAGRHG